VPRLQGYDGFRSHSPRRDPALELAVLAGEKTDEEESEMNRLTTRYKPYAPFEWDGGTFLKSAGSMCPKSFCKNSKKCERNTDRTCPIIAALDRLADYEDTGLMPNEINQQPATNWTPCSEGLPEQDHPQRRMSHYLVSLDNGAVTIAGYGFIRSDSYQAGWQETWAKVIAWQPLPDPYRGDNIPDTTKMVGDPWTGEKKGENK